MRVAIVGSRDYRNLDLVKQYVNELPSSSIVISGGARGVDRTAETAARGRGLLRQIYLADWSKGKGAGMERNSKIVENCDMLVAFWDETSHGTMDSINKAKDAGKTVLIFGKDGLPKEVDPGR